ncbi:limonoid 21-O-acetyltransferse-like [Apium graveolens]|uniref:limonoid 21-O-acetyltransferse-like n=1 Tax=Apium graveolens TaxID=4045 RepID=UPI003D797667
MALDIEVLSKQSIKPSVPTPQHLKKYTLSFLDQIIPHVFVPLIFYYTIDIDQAQNNLTSNHLKKSLSETHVDCNDEGALYVEAQTNYNLQDIIRDPIPNELINLIPLELDDANVDLNFAIQVNFFKCGGIAIGAVFSHKLADGLSYVNFMNSWAAIARGEPNVPSPILDLANLFPPLDMSGLKNRKVVSKKNIVCKRFRFDASNILALKNKCTEDNKNKGTEDQTQPTRFEALSAFIWNRYMAATGKNAGVPRNINKMVVAVNLRTRFDPPLPKHYFGNIYCTAIFTPSMQNGGNEDYGDFVNKAREAIRCIDKNYVEKLRKGEDYLMYMNDVNKRFDEGEVFTMSYTSWSKFGVYDVDFRWGDPVWVGAVRLTFSHVVTYFDNKEGDGIEAWINFKEDDMAKFKADQDLMSFVYSQLSD